MIEFDLLKIKKYSAKCEVDICDAKIAKNLAKLDNMYATAKGLDVRWFDKKIKKRLKIADRLNNLRKNLAKKLTALNEQKIG